MSLPEVLPLSLEVFETAVPAYIPDHAAQGLARLAEQFKDLPNLAAVLNAVGAQTQDLEDAMFGVLVSRDLDAATGDALDQYGAIVQQSRSGLDDETYRLYIKAKIQVNRSSGTPENLYAIFVPLTDAAIRVVEYPPAAFELLLTGAVDSVTAAVFAKLLQRAKAAGVLAFLRSSTWAAASTLTLDSGPGLDVGHLADLA